MSVCHGVLLIKDTFVIFIHNLVLQPHFWVIKIICDLKPLCNTSDIQQGRKGFDKQKSVKQIHGNRNNHILQRTQSPNDSFALSKQQQKQDNTQEHCSLCFLIAKALLHHIHLTTFSL